MKVVRYQMVLIEMNKYIGHRGIGSKLSTSAVLLSSIMLYDTYCWAAVSTEFGGKTNAIEVDFSEISCVQEHHLKWNYQIYLTVD